MPVIDMTKIRTEKNWKNRIKNTCKKGFEKTKALCKWVKENPKEALIYLGSATGVIKAGGRIVRLVNRNRALKQEKFHRDRQVYDHSLKMMLTTKRKLTKEDFDRVNKLRNENPGMRTSEALSKLNLLK